MRLALALAVLACLVVAGCTDNGKRSDDDRFGGF
jgi:outer membrane murein-binding lipoprotein Lpp